MPRKAEPTDKLKQIIWDIAGSAATDNFSAIYREVEYRLEELRKKEELFEDTPDPRKVRRIIKLDINRLSQEVVVSKLPPHVWRLREDYEAIKQLAAESIGAEQEAPKETRVEQKPREEISYEQQAEVKLVAQQLIQKWRLEVASYSPAQLLQRWLDEAPSVALSRFFTNEDTKRLYLEARRPHFETLDVKRLALQQVESDPAFGLLQQKFPTSNVWTALDAWGEQAIPYLRAFYHMLDDPESAAHSALDEEQVDNGNLSVFITRCMIERSYAVLLTCDLLARGLAALPGNVRWVLLGNDLEKLRLRVSLELSSLTRHTPKGGWSSGIKDICALDFLDPLEETRSFLNELVKLQSAEDSLAIALQELESRI